MRLQQYINEDVRKLSLEEMNDLIQKDCKPYLKLIKGKRPMVRGIHYTGISGKKIVRKNRRSLGMPKHEANALNNWLQKNGHNRRDKSFMTTSDPTRLAMFGQPYMVFPIDKMSYTYIDAHDANMTTDSTGWSPDMIGTYFGLRYTSSSSIDNFKKPFEEYFHTDKGWDYMYRKKYECWIKCHSYYFIQINSDWTWNTYKGEVETYEIS